MPTLRDMPEYFHELKAGSVAVAPGFGVSPELHVDDHLLEYISRGFGPVDAVTRYLGGGRANADQVLAALGRLSFPRAADLDVLEFASGYGRVTRHLAKGMPTNFRLVASDIHPQACSFIREKLHVDAFLSSLDPRSLRIDRQFDFVFVLSLFSHLPDKTFGRWLKVLYDALKPGGYLLFTTHGQYALDKHPDFFQMNFNASSGWGYRLDSDQPDIEGAEYGSMVVTIPYVANAIAECGARVIGFSSGTWFGLQDEWLIHKRPT